MTREGLMAWNLELQEVHHRLEDALNAAHASLSRGDRHASLGQDLRVPCRAFCSSLDGHHRGEDGGLFPRLMADIPELRPVIEELMQGHVVIAGLIADLERSLNDENSTPEALLSRLDATKGFMKNHFAYEERELHGILRTLDAKRTERMDLLGSIAL